MNNDDPKTKYVYCNRASMGIVVIVAGALFLLRNFGIPLPFESLHNWWALFILLGAAPSLSFAFYRLRTTGRVDAAVLHSLMSAAAVITVALFFLLELSWRLWWPLFVIYGGLWMIVKEDRRRHPGA